MNNTKPVILLPEVLPILRARPNQSIVNDREEFTIYFRNVVYPWRDYYHIDIECRYGGNFGSFWRISEIPEDVSRFALTLRVYGDWGELIASKKCVVEVYTKLSRGRHMEVLCLGDSMTHVRVYVHHISEKLSDVCFTGTRSFNDMVFMEGRGGWTSSDYTRRFEDGWGGTSPFLFPKGIAGKDYFGDLTFMQRIRTPDLDSYSLDGYTVQEILPGQYFCRDGKLWLHQTDGDVIARDVPEWEFSFGKYLERNQIEPPQIVSILLGANDMQCRFDQVDERVRNYLDTLNTIIEAIRADAPDTHVTICMPVGCAEQYAWGLRGNGSAAAYTLGIVKANMGILERWDCREAEHIHICPMLAFADPDAGIDRQWFKDNIYSETQSLHHANWVHPNRTGYSQMGDSLAAMIEKIRRGEETEK